MQIETVISMTYLLYNMIMLFPAGPSDKKLIGQIDLVFIHLIFSLFRIHQIHLFLIQLLCSG
jgi:hypothetical protein